MTLNNLISTLNKPKAYVTVQKDGEVVIIFGSAGYESLDETLLAETVIEWTIESSTEITVILEDSYDPSI